MRLFSKLFSRPLIPRAAQGVILDAIREAESKTSGEVRVFIESRCRFVDPVDRAKEVFYGLKMAATKAHNGVLVYVALKDHQLAIFGDEGIHVKTGTDFWIKEINKIAEAFRADHIAEGIAIAVKDIGEALRYYFPYDKDTDKNELPDDIVFGH